MPNATAATWVIFFWVCVGLYYMDNGYYVPYSRATKAFNKFLDVVVGIMSVLTVIYVVIIIAYYTAESIN